MKKVILRIGITAVVCGMGVGVWLNGCCKKCTNPPDPEPAEHVFYVAARLDENTSLVKTFSVEQEAFVDSFIVDSFEIYDMAVAGNDEKLFIAGEGLRVYDISSKNLLLSTTDYCCGVGVSPNSEYCDTYGGGLNLLSLSNYLDIYSDDHGSSGGNFSFDSDYFIYKRDSNIIAYNVQDNLVENSFQLTRNGTFFRIYKIWPTVDMTKLFLIGNQGQNLYFAVTDFASDTVRVLQAPLRTGGEDAAVSPDGKYLYFVNTPSMDAEMPRMKVDVYDVNTEQLITSISTQEYNYFEPGHIALTADGKYLMVTPQWMGSTDVLLIDAQNFVVMGSYHFEDQLAAEIVCAKH